MSINYSTILVSVICRSVNRPELAEALRSLARQTHSHIEIVLVDAGARGLGDYAQYCPEANIKLVNENRPLDRPEAANVGLDNCTGDYIMFLDEDDWISVDHIENLVSTLQQQSGFGVAYSSTQKTDVKGKPLADKFCVDYDPLQLKIDNYIPIHSALFDSKLLESGCRFDESLSIYEDWDFWLQLSTHTNFIHLDKITAFYRAGGESTTAVSEQDVRFQPGHPNALAREKVIQKWLPNWSAADINHMLGRMDQSSEIKALQASNHDLHQHLRLTHQQLRSAQREIQGLNHSVERVNAELNSTAAQYRELEQLHQDLNIAHQNLDSDLRDILASFSWRVTKPYRFLKRRMDIYVLQPTFGGLKKKLVQFVVNKPLLHKLILRGRTAAAEVTSSESAQIYFNFDSPEEKNCVFLESLELQGWAVDKKSELNVTVYIDGQEYRSVKPSEQREDISLLYPNFFNVKNCGVNESISLQMLGGGKHNLKLVIANNQGIEREYRQDFFLFKGNDLYNAWLHSQIPEQNPQLANPEGSILADEPVQVLLICSGDDERDMSSLQSLQEQFFTGWNCHMVSTNNESLLQRFYQSNDSAYPGQFNSAKDIASVLTDIRASGQRFICLEGGEILLPHALQKLVELANSSTAEIIYSDHDLVDSQAIHCKPYFTFGWSPDHLLSRNYVGGVFLASANLLPASLDHYTPNPAWRYQLLLELSLQTKNIDRVAKILWSELQPPLISSTQRQEKELHVVENHLRSQDLLAEVKVNNGDRFIDWALRSQPKVSIIIPTMGKLQLIKPCLESLVNKTSYADFEIIMLDNSRGLYPEGIRYLHDKGFTVVECDEDFNWARLNNIGAQHASGSLLLFLNDDIEIDDELWLHKLVKQALRPGVGTVGARLYFPNGCLQHAGVFLVNYGGGGLHLFHKMRPGEQIFQRLDTITREVSANTGACLMTSRDKFNELGGFDEELSVVGNDVDFCLRMIKKGYRNIWTPDCSLIHHESISRKSTVPVENEAAMWRKWGHVFKLGDQYYNPNLSLIRFDCEPEFDLPLEQLNKAISIYPPNQSRAKAAKPLAGVNLVGYIRADMGIGEGARSDARALQAVAENFGIINFETGNPAAMTNLSWKHKEMLIAPYDINLLHINADFIATVRQELPAHFFKDRYTIGYWAWELPEIPDDWLPAFEMVDEVWVPSEFVKEAMEKKSPVPVVTIPHCVDMNVTSGVSKQKFNIPANCFTFLSMFDTRSIAERKNPFGAIEAFKTAFEGSDQNCRLLLKVNNPDQDTLAKLHHVMLGYDNIIILDKTYSREEIDELLNAIDCYVSLHRSEGFGLGPAEAMCLGKAAIVTNWSGSTDYMSADNCMPIDYDLVQIKHDHGPYKAGQYWAEPREAHAAEAMRRLVDEPGLADAIGRKARQTIEEHFSPAAVGNRMQQRLREIRSSRIEPNAGH